jgi:hypothetical protein
MARIKRASPTIQVTIGQEQLDRAIKSNSGGCLIADAIKSQYPNLSSVTVDMATIRVSDRQRGERYTYLTPPAAQHVLLSFDQGWPNPTEQLVIKSAVKIDPIKRQRAASEYRAQRLAELAAKEDSGQALSQWERAAITRMTNSPAADRPHTSGPTEVVEQRDRSITIRGGNPIPQGPNHPNLLRGRNRIFGAKLADPGEAFKQAVEAAVNERVNGGSVAS